MQIFTNLNQVIFLAFIDYRLQSNQKLNWLFKISIKSSINILTFTFIHIKFFNYIAKNIL